MDRELWLKAGENGLLGMNIPEEKGGLGKRRENAALDDGKYFQRVFYGMAVILRVFLTFTRFSHSKVATGWRQSFLWRN